MQAPRAMFGSVSDKQVGWILSKSLPVLRISLNSLSVCPSGRPVLSGVKLREMMTGPAYGNPVVGSMGYPSGGYDGGTEPNGLLRSVRRRRARHQNWLRQGEPSFARYLAQVGALGWTIVVPTLLGVFPFEI